MLKCTRDGEDLIQSLLSMFFEHAIGLLTLADLQVTGHRHGRWLWLTDDCSIAGVCHAKTDQGKGRGLLHGKVYAKRWWEVGYQT